jgi:hypothetical protein
MKIDKLICAALSMAGVAFTAGTAAADATQWMISSKCIDVPSWNVSNGTNVELWACNGGSNQEWLYEPDNTIRPAFDPSKCLDLPSWQTADGTLLDIWDCNGGSNQQWTLQNNGSLEGFGGKCVDDPGSQTADGTFLDYWDCNGGGNQKLSFENGYLVPRDVQYCTKQSWNLFTGWSNQDWAEIGSDAWFPVENRNGYPVSCGVASSLSAQVCSYGNVFGDYGGCPF